MICKVPPLSVVAVFASMLLSAPAEKSRFSVPALMVVAPVAVVAEASCSVRVPAPTLAMARREAVAGACSTPLKVVLVLSPPMVSVRVVDAPVTATVPPPEREPRVPEAFRKSMVAPVATVTAVRAGMKVAADRVPWLTVVAPP